MKYKLNGETPRTIVLHGGPGAVGSVSGLADRLPNVIELYNYGQSIDEQLNEINEVVKEYNIKELTLIGHSYGSWLAYIYASKYNVSKVVLIDSGAFETKYLNEMAKRRVNKLTEAEQSKADNYFTKLAQGECIEDLKTFGYLMAKMDSYDLETYSDELIHFDFEGHQRLMKEINQLRTSGELLNYGQNIDAEIIIIHGEKDPHPVEGVTEPFDTIGLQYRLYVIEACGHSPWQERNGIKPFDLIINKELRYDFQSERLGFRRFRTEDLDFFAKMNNKESVMTYFPSVLTAEGSKAFLNRIIEKHQQQGYGLYAVELIDQEQLIGFIGLSKPGFEADFMPCIEIGWRLDDKYWRKGYATEGAKRMLDYARSILKIEDIVSFTAEINEPSIGVMKKIGMTYEQSFSHPKVMNSPLEKHVLYRKRS